VALIELKIELRRTNELLERLVLAAEHLASYYLPQYNLPEGVQPAGAEKLHVITNEEICDREEEEERLRQQGLAQPPSPRSPETERYLKLRAEGKMPLPD
jgi:hypothetical protein